MQHFNNSNAASTRAKHYAQATDFLELWDGSNTEVYTERGLLLLQRTTVNGMLRIVGEFVWDDSNKVGDGEASGKGYAL